jgi:hypothetical protein
MSYHQRQWRRASGLRSMDVLWSPCEDMERIISFMKIKPSENIKWLNGVKMRSQICWQCRCQVARWKKRWRSFIAWTIVKWQGWSTHTCSTFGRWMSWRVDACRHHQHWNEMKMCARQRYACRTFHFTDLRLSREVLGQVYDIYSLTIKRGKWVFW